MFQLALQLGRTVSELCKSLTVRELRYWQAMYQLEPWGFAGSNLQFAALKQMVLMASPRFNPDKKLPGVENFLLDFDPAPEDVRTEEEKAADLSAQLTTFFNDFNPKT